MIENPELAHPANEHEKLFIVFWQNALKTSPSRQQAKQLLHRVADAQEKSIAQSLPDIEESAIREITYEKGAASLLFYRSAFENAPTVTEKNLIETLGKIGQLENDIFDVYKDLQHNIHTLATRCKNISALRLEYATLFQTLEKQLAQTNYPAKNKQKFKSLLAAIVSRGYVCLDFLAHKEKQHNNCFEPQSLQRDELICDMEKPTNQLKSLLYYLKI